MTEQDLNPKGFLVTKDQAVNLRRLASLVSSVEAKYGKKLTVTSGFRTLEDHVRVYREINEKRKKDGRMPLPIPLKSNHLTGNAVDLADGDGKLYQWLFHHQGFLEMLGLWMEEKRGPWCHLQQVSSRSGRRVFAP